MLLNTDEGDRVCLMINFKDGKMNCEFFDKIPEFKENWNNIKDLFVKKEIPAKTTLLNEGDIANKIYFINRGVLRLWNNCDGKDITFQLFFENQIVSSFESFYLEKPSNFTIESIEDTSIFLIDKINFDILKKKCPSINAYITQHICERFIEYTNFYLSQIKDSPLERYENLLRDNPKIINRIPNYYIASYLGITPVSLSRIKKRIKEIE